MLIVINTGINLQTVIIMHKAPFMLPDWFGFPIHRNGICCLFRGTKSESVADAFKA